MDILDIIGIGIIFIYALIPIFIAICIKEIE